MEQILPQSVEGFACNESLETANDVHLEKTLRSPTFHIELGPWIQAESCDEVQGPVGLAILGITFKHGKPYHPQTQGKVERYHQTLKKWLRKQPAATSIEELQRQIDGFVLYYNEQRPHQARGCPPMRAWRELDKATPTLAGQRLLAKTRVRHDRVDDTGCVTRRYRRTLHHISLGRRYREQRIIILMADLDVRVITEDGELIRHFTLNPAKNYQPRKDD